MRRIPTILVRCDPTRDEKACGLLQMAHSVPPTILYSAYWYRSGTNRTMREHLKAIADEASAMVAKREARVLDIGCNDGTLLQAYPNGSVKFGIDPSDVAQEVKGDITVVQDTFPSERLDQLAGGAPFDVITSIAMFYDLEDPVAFVRSIKRSLSPDGIWIFEMSYMPTMLKMNSYDTICHEHLEYYSLAVLENILRPRGDEGRAGRDERHQRRQHPLLRHARGQLPVHEEGVLGAARGPPPGRVRPRARHRSALPELPGARSTSTGTSSRRSSGSSRPTERRSTSTAPRPRATRSCSGAGSTGSSSTSPRSEIRTSTAPAPSGPTSRSSARPNRAR